MKHFQFLALLLCLSLGSLTVKAQDESGSEDGTATESASTFKSYTLGGGNASVAGTGEVSLTFTQQYGAFDLCNKDSIDPAEYTGIRIVCAATPANAQLKVTYSKKYDSSAEAIVDGSHDEYANVLVEGDNNYTFLTNYGKITNIAVYCNDSNGSGSVTIKEAYLVKAASGGDEELTYSPNSNTWSCYSDNVTSGETELKFTALYGQFNICNKSEVDISEYSGVKLTCADLDSVQLKVTYYDGTTSTDKYPSMSEGEKTYPFETNLGNVTLIAIQAAGAQAAEGDSIVASVKLESAYLVKVGDTEEMTNSTSSNSWGYTTGTDSITGGTKYTFSGQYNQYSLTDKSEIDISQYSGYKINCADVDSVQIKLSYADNGNDVYPQLQAGDNEYTFDTTRGNVTLVALQASASYGGSITLNSAYLIKTASAAEEETMVYKGVSNLNPQCEATYPDGSVTAVTFNSVWNAAYVMVNDTTCATYTTGDNTIYYTVVFSEPTTETLLMTAKSDASTDISSTYTTIPVGSTVVTFTLSSTNCTQNAAYIAIEANNTDTSIYPFTAFISSITSTEDVGEAYLSLDRLGTTAFNATCDAAARTITYTGEYGGGGWWFGGTDLSQYEGVEVAVKSNISDFVQLVVECYRYEDYTTKTDTLMLTSNGTSNISPNGKTLYVSFDGIEYANRVRQIYIQNGKDASAEIKVVGARFIEKATERAAYEYKVNLAGYALSNWATGDDNSGNSGSITVTDEGGTDKLGTADLSFTADFGGLGWNNWSEQEEGAGNWNLALFDRVEVYYTTTDETWDDDHYVELFANIGGDKNVTISEQNNKSGVIILPISGDAYLDAKGNTVLGDTIDWTNIGQLVIQASKADMTLTVTGMSFIRDHVEYADSTKTYNLADGIVTLPKTSYSDDNYYIYGDGTNGSSTNYYIQFPLNATGTYNIYLEDVTINTNGAIPAGLSIPKGVEVYLYVTSPTGRALYDKATERAYCTEGVTNITGSEYGIFASYESQLHIIMDTLAVLNVNGACGIYDIGTILEIDYYTKGYFGNYSNSGQVNITADYCGIYAGSQINELRFNGIGMDIEVNGNSSSSIPEIMPTWTDPDGDGNVEKDSDGNVIHYVCGIYNRGTAQTTFSAGTFIINVPGTETYGFYSSVTSSGGGNAVYVGWCYIEINATKCVLHRVDEGQYNRGFVSSGEDVTVSFNGPFCKHVVWGTIWYCDNNYGYSIMNDISNLIVKLDDYHAATSGYNYTGGDITSAIEVEYLNRKLYTGWNTICLPYDYNLNPNDTYDADDYYDAKNDSIKEVEARQIISYYAKLDNISEGEPDSTGVFQYQFTPTSTKPASEDDTNAITLSHDVAYLVYVDPAKYGQTTSAGTDDEGNNEAKGYRAEANEEESTIKADEDGAIEVMFTMMYPGTIYGVQNGDDLSNGDALKVVFTPDSLYHDGTKYKLVRIPDETSQYGFTNYFDLPATQVLISGYRCYLDGDEVGADGATVKLTAVIPDEEEDDMSTTGITEVADVDEDSVVDVYGVDGKLIRIARESEATRGLAKGVYIVGGKKVAVK